MWYAASNMSSASTWSSRFVLLFVCLPSLVLCLSSHLMWHSRALFRMLALSPASYHSPARAFPLPHSIHSTAAMCLYCGVTGVRPHIQVCGQILHGRNFQFLTISKLTFHDNEIILGTVQILTFNWRSGALSIPRIHACSAIIPKKIGVIKELLL